MTKTLIFSNLIFQESPDEIISYTLSHYYTGQEVTKYRFPCLLQWPTSSLTCPPLSHLIHKVEKWSLWHENRCPPCGKPCGVTLMCIKEAGNVHLHVCLFQGKHFSMPSPKNVVIQSVMSYAGLDTAWEKVETQFCNSLGIAGDGPLLVWSNIAQKVKVREKKKKVMFWNEIRFLNRDWTMM